MGLINKMKNLLYPLLKPVELEFSFSGRAWTFKEAPKELKGYSNLKELFEKFEKRLRNLGFEKYFPEDRRIQEIMPKKLNGSTSSVCSIEENWFKSGGKARLFYMTVKVSYQKDNTILEEEFETDGVILASRGKVKKFKKKF